LSRAYTEVRDLLWVLDTLYGHLDMFSNVDGSRTKDNALSSWLIAIVDACHMWDASGDVSIFGALGAGEVVSV
jgi:hypothetical protein